MVCHSDFQEGSRRLMREVCAAGLNAALIKVCSGSERVAKNTGFWKFSRPLTSYVMRELERQK